MQSIDKPQQESSTYFSGASENHEAPKIKRFLRQDRQGIEFDCDGAASLYPVYEPCIQRQDDRYGFGRAAGRNYLFGDSMPDIEAEHGTPRYH